MAASGRSRSEVVLDGAFSDDESASSDDEEASRSTVNIDFRSTAPIELSQVQDLARWALDSMGRAREARAWRMTALVPREAATQANADNGDDSDDESERLMEDVELVEAAERFLASSAGDEAHQSGLGFSAMDAMWEIAAARRAEAGVLGWEGDSIDDGIASSRSLMETASFRSDASMASGSWDGGREVGQDCDSDQDCHEAGTLPVDGDDALELGHADGGGFMPRIDATAPSLVAPRLANAPGRRHSHNGFGPGGDLLSTAYSEPVFPSPDITASPPLMPLVAGISSASSVHSATSARSSTVASVNGRRYATVPTGWHSAWAEEFPAWSDAACADSLIGMIRGATPGFIAYRVGPAPCLSLSLAGACNKSELGATATGGLDAAVMQTGGVALQRECSRRIIGAATAAALRVKNMQQLQRLSKSGQPPTAVMCGELPALLLMCASLAAFTAKDSLDESKLIRNRRGDAGRRSRNKRQGSALASFATASADTPALAESVPRPGPTPLTRRRTSSTSSTARPARFSSAQGRTASGNMVSRSNSRWQASAEQPNPVASSTSSTKPADATIAATGTVTDSTLAQLFAEPEQSEVRRAEDVIGIAPSRLGFSLSEAAVDAISAAIEARLLRVLRGAMWVAVHQTGIAHGADMISPSSVVVTPAAVELAILMTSRTVGEGEIDVQLVSGSHSLLL